MQMYQREEQDPEVERIRAQARQIAANDPELQRERQELANARAAAQKEFDDLQFIKFFDRHPEVTDAPIVRRTLESHARTMDANNGLKAEYLEEALRSNASFLENFINKSYVRPTPANLATDKETLENYCRQNRLSYPGESALRLLRETYGSGIGGAHIAQAVERGLVHLKAESDPEVLAQIEHDEKVLRAYYLRELASPSELRAAVRAEGAKTAQQTAQAEFEQRQKVTAQMQSGYPTLPERALDGQKIDRAYLYKLSSVNYEQFKVLCHRYGTAAVTARMQGQQ